MVLQRLPSGKMILKKVKAGEKYEFENLRLKKNRYNGELYVNPAKAMGSISKSEPFEEVLFIPEYDPTELTTCSITGEILGVFYVHVDYCSIIMQNLQHSIKADKM